MKSEMPSNVPDVIPLMDLREMSERYLEWMRIKGYSDETVKSRKQLLTGFILWCSERGILSHQTVTRQILERYQSYLYHYRKSDGRPLTAGSRSIRIVAVRAFFKWMAKNNHILFNPASELELPKTEHRLPGNVMTIKEVETVLNAVNLKEGMGLRDRAIMETLYSTGLRRTELCRLKCHDIDVSRGIVMVRQGKGRKDRMVPIGKRAIRWIEKYLQEQRSSKIRTLDHGVLFVSQEGKPLRPQHLTRLIRGYVQKSGIGKDGSCHLFRHTMATLMLENGADIRYIQQMLGHSKLETTQVYTHVAIHKLKEIHQKTHPGALQKKCF